MISNLSFKNLDPQNKSEFEAFYGIYSESIEKHEQKPKDKIKSLTDRLDYAIRLSYINKNLMGFSLAYLNGNQKFALLEYMAVDQKARSLGLGTEILKDLSQFLIGQNILWLLAEVDSPYQESTDQKNRIRRVAFYEKNGFQEIEKLNYLLPLPTVASDLAMKILVRDLHNSKTSALQSSLVRQMIQNVYTQVYGCEPADSRLKSMFENLPNLLNLKRSFHV